MSTSNSPSSEGFPNALGEAMSHSLACISFDCEAGPSDLIDNGVNGFLVKEHDHNDYMDKLKILINNESIRVDFGRKATSKVSIYSVEKVGRQYLEVLKGY